MKRIIIIAVVAALVLSLGVVAYAANSNRTSQPETTQGEQLPAEAPQTDEEAPADLPEMDGQPPQTGGEAPADLPEMNGQPPQMDGEAPADLPEMNGQPPQMNGEKPFGLPDMIDFDEMVENGVISQETCDKIKAYMEENKPSCLPEIDGQAPEMNAQPSEMDGEAPSDLPEMNGQPPQMDGQVPEMDGQPFVAGGESPANGGLLNDLLNNGIITQAEYDALSEAIAQ